MKLPQLVLACIIANLNLFAQDDTIARTEYFADFTFWESPYQPFRGAFQISKEVANERIHLQLDYDTSNRIVAAHVKIGSYYKEFEGANGSMAYNAPLTKVAYSEKEEIHTFYDRFGNQTSVMGNVFKKVYKKDEHQRNIQLTFLDKNDNETANWFGYTIYEWEHHLDGSIIETRRNKQGEISPLRGSFQFLTTKMIPGPDGYFSTLMNIDEQGNMVNAPCGAAILKYYFDTQGRFSKWEVFDKEGKPAIGPSNTAGEYNTFHKYELEDIVFYDTQNNPAVHWSGAERWHHEVDSYGNNITREFRKADNSLMNGNSGYAKAEYVYSDDGRFLISQAFYDANEKKVNHLTLGIHKIIYTRDALGRVISREYQGVDDQLINRKDNGVARVVISYKNDGTTILTNYDKDGNEVKV